MCGRPSHIHGTFHWAFIFKGRQDTALRIEQTSDCMSVFICVRARRCLRARTYMRLVFKAKVLLPQTARVWHITDTRWIQNAETEHRCTHAHTHTGVCSHLWTSVMTDHRLAYFTSQVLLSSKGGRVSRNIKALFFSFSPGRMKTCHIHKWEY